MHELGRQYSASHLLVEHWEGRLPSFHRRSDSTNARNELLCQNLQYFGNRQGSACFISSNHRISQDGQYAI